MNQVTFISSLRTSVCLAAVVGLGLPLPALAAGWSTTKVTDSNIGPYCAVSRKIDSTIVTIGRTARGESSLAVELSDAGLKAEKVYRVSMKPGASERLEIETRPINANTFVLNVDKIVDLQSAFKDSPTLQVKYDDRALSLLLNDWPRADQDLTTCLATLAPDKPAPSKPLATKGSAKPVADVQTTPTPPPTCPVVDRSEIQNLAEQNKTLQGEIAALKSTNAAGLSQAATMAAECDQMKAREKALNDQIAMLRAAQSRTEADTKTVTDLNARLGVLAAENTTLKTQLETARLVAATAAPAPAVASVTDDAEKMALRAERDALVKENATLAQNLATQTTNLANTKTLADEIGKLKVENTALQAKLDVAKTNVAQSEKSAASEKQLADLQAQVDQLERERIDLQSKLAIRDEAKAPTPAIADLERRLEMMSAENLKLRADLASARTPEAELRASVAAEAPLRQQLRDMRAENQALKAKTEEMSKLLDNTQRDQERVMLGASGKDWDLDKATRRLQETERDVQRLSIALRDHKAQCDAEKKQIEYMLFDPKLAKEGQIALLNSLEDQIAELRATKGLPPVVGRPAIAAAQPVIGSISSYDSEIRMEPLPASKDTANVAATPGMVGYTSLLKQAGVALTSTLTPIAKNPFGMGKAWRYESGELAGLVVEQTTIKPAAFDETTQKQIQGLKTVCKGDFAAEQATSQTAMGIQYASFDAACISGANSTSAAVLFYQKDGVFNVISHEAAPDSMAKAMDARDKVITTLVGK